MTSTDERLDGIGTQDHSSSAEYRIFGPPGTGKTTSLIRQIRRGIDRFGKDSVLVTSFSRAAATELCERALPFHLDRIGTLHSHCFRALGMPTIAEVQVDEWNRENPRLKIMPVSKQVKLDGEDAAEEDPQVKDGDRLLQGLNRCRAMMLPPGHWPAEIREFCGRWNRYKKANGLLDFTDLVETALRDLAMAPGKPSVIVADEAQDLNRLQMTLIRRWGQHAEYSALAGDDDQTIFSWAGASADTILDPDIPEDHKVFLKQSERVPRAIYTVAERLIRQVSRRQEKAYLPRPADGEVHRLSEGGYRSPEYGILKTAERHLAQGKSIMFLASCSYMLRPVIAVLRKNGIPFHNPYRKANGFWNPLRTGSRQSAASRTLALLMGHTGFGAGHRDWKRDDLILLMEWLRRSALKEGAADFLSALLRHQVVNREILEAIFETEALAKLVAALAESPGALLRWWRDHLAADFRKRVQFPADIAALRGPQTLQMLPRVVVGTIHSVKGGQADVVYLFPDLSRSLRVPNIADAACRGTRCSVPSTYWRYARPRNAVHLLSPGRFRVDLNTPGLE